MKQPSCGELGLAILGFAILSLVYTYPLVRAPAQANRFDSPDALLNAWILSWDLFQLPRDPLHLFDANIFYPETGTLAYSENLLVAAVFTAPFALFSSDPLLLSNIALLLALVTSGVAAYALGYQTTGCRIAAALAGVLFAFAPYRWAHIPHLQLQLAFGIPASVYFLGRLESGSRTAGLGLAVTIAATFGSSAYYAVYLLTALPIFVSNMLARIPAQDRRRVLKRLATAGLLAALLSLPLTLPYLTKFSSGAQRSLAEASDYSAGLTEYVSSFSLVHASLPKAAEPLFPGFVALGLALWAIRSRLRESLVWMVAAVLGVALSLGPKLGLFTLLYRTLPPYQALRVPSRAGILFLFAVSCLAAIGVSRLGSRKLRVALVLLVGLECYPGPLPFERERPSYPSIYRSLEAVPEGAGAVVELPLPPPERFQDNAIFVYRSIYHRRPLVNGYSGFVPESYRRAHRLLMREDLSKGLSLLSGEGLRFVIAHRGRLGPRMRRQLGRAEDDGLIRLLDEQGSDRLYQVR